MSPSLPATVIYLLTASGLDLAPTVLTGTRILFLLIEFCLLWQLWRMDKDLSQSIFDVFLAALLAATSWVQPWYLLSLLAIAPMCDAGRRKVAAVFSASALTIYLFNLSVQLRSSLSSGSNSRNQVWGSPRLSCNSNPYCSVSPNGARVGTQEVEGCDLRGA